MTLPKVFGFYWCPLHIWREYAYVIMYSVIELNGMQTPSGDELQTMILSKMKASGRTLQQIFTQPNSKMTYDAQPWLVLAHGSLMGYILIASLYWMNWTK